VYTSGNPVILWLVSVEIQPAKMIIRQAQVDSFNEDASQRFEDDMVEHLKSVYPRYCETIGDEAVRTVIRLGLVNSKKHDFTLRGPVRFFIELMFMFGSYFDSDVQHPWVREALRSQDYPEEMFRADYLHQKMMEYLNAVSGPDHAYAKRALRETRRMAADVTSKTSDVRNELLSRLMRVYPEKCEWLGTKRLAAAIDGGLAVAQENLITSARGAGLLGLLAFVLGHRFAEDPLYPCISKTLRNPLIANPNARAESLEKQCLLHLDGLLKDPDRN
jgi:hypothetical protein